MDNNKKISSIKPFSLQLDVDAFVPATEDEKAMVSICYNGPGEDFLETADELSVALVKGMAGRIEYRETDSEEYVNELSLEIYCKEKE